MRKRVSTCLGVALLSCMLLGNRMAFANVRPTAEEFPEKTIIIGTYAIVLDVVNEELLELALQSAEMNMQNEVYFKSDINSGIWYNITNSDNISDISESTANIVKNQEIDKLYLTHYTNASGVTISFLTNRQVYVSDIDTPQVPTNIVELDELENELKIQQALYDSVKDAPEDETEKEEDKRLDKKAIYSQKINSLKEVLKTIEHKEIEKLTAQIHAVENLERELVKKGVDNEKIEMIVSQKENLKNTRMAYCYQILIDKMNKENISIDYEDCNDLIQKYAGAITSLESILSELGIATDKVASTIGDEDDVDETFSDNPSSGEVFEEEATGVNKIIEENLALMLEYAESGNFAKAEEALEEAYVAETVKNNDNTVSEEVKEKQKEVLKQAIELLEQEVLELVQAGDGKDYKEAVKNKESNAVLEAIKEETVRELSELLTQLEDNYTSFGEKTERAKEKASLLQEKIKTYEELLSAIPFCEVRKNIIELLQGKLDDTKEQLNEIKLQAIPQYQETVAIIESTEKQIETLNEKYLEAVEENNTEDSKQYKIELENAVNDLVSAENKLEQLEKEFMEGTLKSELELEEITSSEDVKEKKEHILKELDTILSGEASIEAVSNLLQDLKQVEKGSILSLQKLADSKDILEETKNMLENSSLDFEKLLLLVQEGEEASLLKEELQKTKETIGYVDDLLTFMEEINQKVEKKLQVTTKPLQQITVLSDVIEDYKGKLNEIEKENVLSKEMKDGIKGAVQKEIGKLEQQIEVIQINEKIEDSLNKLEQEINKEESKTDEFSELLSAFAEIEMLRFEGVTDLAEAIAYVQEALSDLKKLSHIQGVMEEEQEVLQKELQQLEEQKQCLEEYFDFIKKQKKELEQKLQKTTNSLQQVTILSDGIEDYKEKLEEIENVLQKEVQNCVKTALQKEIDTLELQIALLQAEEEKDAMLQALEQVIAEQDDSLESVFSLLENFNKVEQLSLKQVQGLEEAIAVKEEVLSDFEKLLQEADKTKKGLNLIEEKIQQIKAELAFLEEYLAFIEKTNQTLETKLEKTMDMFEQKVLLSNAQDSYKEKVDNVEHSLEEVDNGDSSLKEELKQCIVTALQEEISDITKKEQEIQNKIQARLKEILGEKSELSATNKALAQAQEQKYSEKELHTIATLTDSLREEYAKKDAELIYPWLIIFKEYDVKLTLPAIKIKEEIYIPVEELAIQLGADILISKTNDVIVIKGRNVLIEYILNDNTVYVNDKKMMITLPPAKEIKNQVYISLQCFVRAYRLEEATYSDYTILSEK